MKKNQEFEISRDGNNIYIYSLAQTKCVNDFICVLYDGRMKGYEEFNIHWNGGEDSPIYPNVCVPIAGIIEYYKNQGVDFYFDINLSIYLNNCGFSQPNYYSPEEIKSLLTPFNQIIKYDNSLQVAAFTQKCVDYISHQVVCEDGAFESLIWCINEVMDNVLVHSQSEFGYVMAQFHATNKHIAICVSDTGIGIFNTLKNSKHHPGEAIDALTLSIQEGIGDGQGQGNGLFGLSQIVKKNSGRLRLTSGSASLILENDSTIRKYNNLRYLDKRYQGTTVDFQLDLARKVDIKSAFSSIGGFDGFDIRIDDMFQDNGTLLYNIFENCEGTATRDAGRLLRNDIINTIKRTRQKMVLDFNGIDVVSSSFIDELIAKMILEMGIITFNQTISIININDTIKYLCERSIYMRIHEAWNVKEH